MVNSEAPKTVISRNDIARRFKRFREARELTQQDMASAFGIHTTAISDVEHGKQKLTDHQLATLHQLYGLNLAWLLLGEEPMFNHEIRLQEKVAEPIAPAYNPAEVLPSDIVKTIMQSIQLVEQRKVSITITISPVAQGKGTS
jgi:transcriptional regulator with XRE-family HTH domain